MTTILISYLIWPSAGLALIGTAALAIKSYARHKLVKVALKNVDQKRRAEVIAATALLLDERHAMFRRSARRRLWIRSGQAIN